MAKIGLPIFLDLKLHDIPNGGEGHPGAAPARTGDPDCPRRGRPRDAGRSESVGGLNTKVVAVTVLTSLDAPDLDDIGVGGTPHDQVVRLAALARNPASTGLSAPDRRSKRRARRGRVAFRRPGRPPANGKAWLTRNGL